MDFEAKMQKTGRNDPCVCGSGKKFKKCCERKMIGKRFMATKIDTQNLSSISSFFQKVTHVNNQNVEEPKKINAQLNSNESFSHKLSVTNLQS